MKLHLWLQRQDFRRTFQFKLYFVLRHSRYVVLITYFFWVRRGWNTPQPRSQRSYFESQAYSTGPTGWRSQESIHRHAYENTCGGLSELGINDENKVFNSRGWPSVHCSAKYSLRTAKTINSLLYFFKRPLWFLRDHFWLPASLSQLLSPGQPPPQPAPHNRSVHQRVTKALCNLPTVQR